MEGSGMTRYASRPTKTFTLSEEFELHVHLRGVTDRRHNGRSPRCVLGPPPPLKGNPGQAAYVMAWVALQKYERCKAQ